MKKILFSLCVAIAALWSCSKDRTNEKLAAEEQKLAGYMQASLPDAVKIKDGLYFAKETANEDGLKPEAGKFVLVDYMLHTLYDDVLERTSYKDYASHGSAYPSLYKEGGPEIWQLSAPLTGIYEGIGEMNEKETANIYFYSKYNTFYPYQDFTTRRLWVRLVKVIEDLTVYQESLMSGCLAEYSTGVVDTATVQCTVDNTPYRVMHRVVSEGTGNRITENMTVKSRTSISYLLENGDMNEHVSGQDKDWNTANGSTDYTKTNFIGEILREKKKGSTVVIAFPYKLLYGNKDLEKLRDSETQQCLVPLNSVIILKIELI